MSKYYHFTKYRGLVKARIRSDFRGYWCESNCLLITTDFFLFFNTWTAKLILAFELKEI